MVVNNSVSGNRFATFESFRANRPSVETPKPAEVTTSAEVTKPAEADNVEITKPAEQSAPPAAVEPEDAPKKKRSFFQKCKDFYAGFKKGIITGWEYTVGAAKGIVYGGAAVCSVLGVDAIVNAVKRVKASKVAETVAENAPKLAKTFSTKGKIIAGVVGALVMGYQLFQAHLNSNEQCAGVDHRWGTGHSNQ